MSGRIIFFLKVIILMLNYEDNPTLRQKQPIKKAPPVIAAPCGAQPKIAQQL